MTQKPRTRKTAIERKKEIIQTAIKLAAVSGPDRLTTENLAREIGISQAAIFRHFPTKGDIWSGVAAHIGEMMKIPPEFIEAGQTAPSQLLRDLVSKQLAFIQSTPAIPDILFSRELHANNDKMRMFFSGMMRERQKIFSNLVRLEIASGNYKKNLDENDAAWLVLSLIQGQAMRWSLDGRKYSLVTEGQRLFELLLSGFRQ